MKHTTTLFAMIAVVAASIALAAPPKHAKKPNAKTAKVATVKIIDVWTDPIYQEEVPRDTLTKPTVVGNYRLHFGDPASEVAFARLSAKRQVSQDAEEAAKKDSVREAASEKKDKN